MKLHALTRNHHSYSKHHSSIPPSIQADKRDVAALALLSAKIHHLANKRLYSEFEISMCKSSERYFCDLWRTLNSHQDLANLCTSLVVDTSLTCPVKEPRQEPVKYVRVNEYITTMVKRKEVKGRTPLQWNDAVAETLRDRLVRSILPLLVNLRTMKVSIELLLLRFTYVCH